MKTIIQRCLKWSRGHDKIEEFDENMYNINRYLKLKEKVKELRTIALTGIAEAGSGHPGASFSAAEIMGCVYFQILNNDIKHPSDPESRLFHQFKGSFGTGILCYFIPCWIFQRKKSRLYEN